MGAGREGCTTPRAAEVGAVAVLGDGSAGLGEATSNVTGSVGSDVDAGARSTLGVTTGAVTSTGGGELTTREGDDGDRVTSDVVLDGPGLVAVERDGRTDGGIVVICGELGANVDGGKTVVVVGGGVTIVVAVADGGPGVVVGCGGTVVVVAGGAKVDALDDGGLVVVGGERAASVAARSTIVAAQSAAVALTIPAVMALSAASQRAATSSASAESTHVRPTLTMVMVRPAAVT